MAKKKRRVDRGSKRSYPSETDSRKRYAGFLVHIREALVLSFLVVLVFLIYSNTLGGPFVFDDLDNIKNNPHIRLTTLTPGGITEAGLESLSSNRPVANITFALNYYFHQYNVLGYHLVNIIVHVMTGVFLYLFVKTTLSLPSLRSRYGPHGWIPLITAFIWLVHPLQTQSVTYMVQRMNSMAAMFYVLSFWLYVRARLAEANGKKRVLLAGCILAGVLSLGSKEIAATLPFFIFLYEWYFFQDLSRNWLKTHLLPFAGIFIFLAIVAFMYLGVNPLGKILMGYDTRDFTLTQRMLTEFRVVIYYITLLIFPHPSRLNLDHDFLISHSLIDPITTMLSIGAIGGLVGFTIYMAKKDRLLSFCILWFLGNLVIESSVIGLEIIFEHRTYLPSMLVILMAVTLGYRYIKSKRRGVAVLFTVLLVFSVWTYERNSVWGDDLTLWKDCVAKSPKKARVQYNLGNAFARKGKIEKAVDHYSEALRIRPHLAKVHNNLGIALERQGKLNEAIDHYSEALRINADYEEAHYNLGNALKSQGKLKRAMVHYSEALRIDPDYLKAHNNLGIALASQGKLKEAMGHFSSVLRIQPDHAQAHNNLGVVLARQGRLKEAVHHFSQVLRIQPDGAEARQNLERCLKLMGKSADPSSIVVRP